MTPAVTIVSPFKWRHFAPEIILTAVRWHLRYSLSLRDVEGRLAERGLEVDHTTIWRWVQRYAPELGERLRSHRQPTNDSWRVDETYVRVKGKWVNLYRAVNSSGATLDFLLSEQRDVAAAKCFPGAGAARWQPPEPTRHQHRQTRRLPAGHFGAQARRCTGRWL